MIEDILRLEETGESYIWFIQYESRDLPHSLKADTGPGRPENYRWKIKHKKRKNVFENEFCEINWFVLNC